VCLKWQNTCLASARPSSNPSTTKKISKNKRCWELAEEEITLNFLPPKNYAVSTKGAKWVPHI
jgi:hypothetical protein